MTINSSKLNPWFSWREHDNEKFVEENLHLWINEHTEFYLKEKCKINNQDMTIELFSLNENNEFDIDSLELICRFLRSSILTFSKENNKLSILGYDLTNLRSWVYRKITKTVPEY